MTKGRIMKHPEDTTTIDLVDQYTITALEACKERISRLAAAIGINLKRIK